MENPKSRKGMLIGGVITLLAIGGAAVYALSSGQNQVSDSDAPRSGAVRQSGDEATPAPTSGQNESITIRFTDQGFEPQTISVKRGTTIVVKNDSSRDVQFSSDDHPTHLENREMNLATLEPGESDSFFANTAGSWGFHDHLDESNTGKLEVTE